MISPKIQADDNKRVEILNSYKIYGTDEEDIYDDIARLATSICECEKSLISFIDSKKQWLKAHHGTDLKETTREVALCSHTINNTKNTLYVPSTRADLRFKYNPLVTGPENIQSYAGVPIVTPEGYAIGAVCVIDTKPMRLSRMQLELLVTLRDLVMKLLILRKSKIESK